MAQNFIRYCPACSGELAAVRLSCNNCGLELSGQFVFNKFTYLEGEALLFADTFFKHSGNLKEVQRELHMSYPAARKRLRELQSLLGYPNPTEPGREPEPSLMALPVYGNDSTVIRAIKESLNRSGGLAHIPLSSGKEISVWYEEYGNGLCADNLPSKRILTWQAFDCAVALMKKRQAASQANSPLDQKNGRAPKGNAMKYKLGEEGLGLDTIEGYVAFHAYGARKGDSVVRIVPALSAVLVWAGLCKNGRGYLELTTPSPTLLN